jgi:hypothetical protein
MTVDACATAPRRIHSESAPSQGHRVGVLEGWPARILAMFASE